MILEKIVAAKKQRLQKNTMNMDALMNKISTSIRPYNFYEVIEKTGLSIIGEIKKASPSKGVIREVFQPIEIAKEYENAVDAISILTEEDFFLGSPEYLQDVSKTVALPLLRKDFIIDPIQIYEARSLGASAVLLITAILTPPTLKEFIALTYSLGMDALVEVHTEEETQIACEAEAKIIGINNRNLKDFSIDLETTISLREKIPKDTLVVSESGIHTREDIKILKKAKINGILVGESFMKSRDIREKAKEFKESYDSES